MSIDSEARQLAQQALSYVQNALQPGTGSIAVSVADAQAAAQTATDGAQTATDQAAIATDGAATATQASASAQAASTDAQEEALTATTAASQAMVAAAIQNCLPTAVAAGGALPYEVRSITGGGGTGGTPGTYAGITAGGPPGFLWQVFVGSDGKAIPEIINPGISTSNAAPTLTMPTIAGLTGNTALVVTVDTIPVGRYFSAPSSDSAQVLAWGNNAGAIASAPFGGTQLAMYTKAGVDAAVADFDNVISEIELDDPDYIPLIKIGRSVVLWMNGGISFSSLGVEAQAAVVSFLNTVGAIPTQVVTDAGWQPLLAIGKNTVLWMENGGITWSSLADSAIAQINALVQGRQYPFGRNAPIATDGRSLYQYRSKLGLLDTGSVVRPTVLVTGDSYMELPALPQAIATSLYTAHGKAGDGWLSAHTPNSMNGIMRQTVGTWTTYDASDGVAPTMGCGIDGKSTSTTGTTQRELLSGVTCTEWTIYYYDGNGSFQYGIYDGANVDTWYTVNCGGTNTTKSVTLSGLPNAAHNFELRTVGNTGTVAIHGYRATCNSAAGIIFDKCGNAGAVSNNLVMFSDQLVNFQSMAPDLIMMALGTNNASVQSTTAQFESDVPALIDSWRALWPNVGIVLIAQPLCTGVKQSPLIDYRDAAYQIALAKDCDFFSMFDDWADFNTMNGLGMFLGDGIHPSVAGSAFTARRITQFMGL